MNTHELKQARLDKGWTQTQAAARLGMTQAYLNFLENGKRRLTPKVVSRATSVYGLSPSKLPVSADFAPKKSDDQKLTAQLAKLGYPGFQYLRSHAKRENPAEVLLDALGQEHLDSRVVEALPWVALNYATTDEWLVKNARKHNLQNRLGFVVTLARSVAEKQNSPRLGVLNNLEQILYDSRLAKEDVFGRAPRTNGEKDWLKQNQTPAAAQWNLLTDLKTEQLQYA
jgi:transcriptional regulator with XRE-family HTH domain